MSDAYKTLPELSKKQKEDWVTDEVLNLCKKKKDAWLLLCGIGKNDDSLKLKYHHLCKLRRLLLRRLKIPGGMHVQLKQRSSNLTGDDDKLQHWVEHFSDIVNYESEVSMATLDALPVLELPSALSDDVCVDELSDNLTEEEIAAAISQMKKERAPGLDGISTEMLEVGWCRICPLAEDYCRWNMENRDVAK